MKITLRLLILTLVLFAGIPAVLAASNIDSTDRWAWNDAREWIDFYDTNTVEVTATGIKGYAVFDDAVGDEISFDCATTSVGSICGVVSYQVTNDGAGVLAGYAWNPAVGWISFNCDQTSAGGTDTCATSNYGVVINPSTGVFSGYAWNDAIGWISFNCSNTGTCGTSNYKLKTSWVVATIVSSGYVISNTFDTGIVKGAAFNSILWNGTLEEAGNIVKFQLATSNCENGADDPNNEDGLGVACDNNVGWGGGKVSGDGAFIGDGGFSTTYYQPVGPGVPAQIVVADHNNKRYYRYQMYIERATGNTISPIVTSVAVNWSQ